MTVSKENKESKNQTKSQFGATISPKIASKMQKKRDINEITNNIIEEKKQCFRSFFFQGYSDYDIFVRAWDNVSKAKAVILITHGMVEHGLRYDDFAKFLNSRGYIVVAPDIRAHGKTAGAPDQIGRYQGDLFGDIVRDNMKLADTLKNYYKLPLVVFGHSYGSFITQEFIQNYQKHSAVILIGSASFKGRLDAKMGKVIADITALFKGKDAKANMIYNMTFGKYGKGKEDGNWLTHDNEIFKKYCDDPYCGLVCSAQFYRSFFKHLAKLHAKEAVSQIDTQKPILITSGQDDPVAGKGHKMLDKLFKLYKVAGVKDVTYKLWANGYHEILNETFRQDIYEYIADWLDKRFK